MLITAIRDIKGGINSNERKEFMVRKIYRKPCKGKMREKKASNHYVPGNMIPSLSHLTYSKPHRHRPLICQHVIFYISYILA